MTIRIFPSRLPGEPLETHQHGATTLGSWLRSKVPGYSADVRQPIAVEVDGRPVSPTQWDELTIAPHSDVRIYPVPYGTGLEIAAWAAVAVSVASEAYSLIMMRQMGRDGMNMPGSGDQLDLSPAKANTAKLGDPIREVFGRYRVYPDYVVQPVSRFDRADPKVYRTEIFLSVGMGRFIFNPGDICIGTTPISAFGEDVSVTIYPPGADLGAEHRADNWFHATEVGGTASGTAGLDLASTGPSSVGVTADSVAVSGSSLVVQGGRSGDDGKRPVIPATWKAGSLITITAPQTFVVGQGMAGMAVQGDLTELAPVAGMPITLTWSNRDYDLLISRFDAGRDAVPGEGGTAASLTASAAPSTYDFSKTPVSFTLSWAGRDYVIAFSTNLVTLAGLVSAVNDPLRGSGLVADKDNGRLRIREAQSPYSGNRITASLLPEAVFGDAPVLVEGKPSTGGSPAIPPTLWLTWPGGEPFGGIPEGPQRLALAPRGKQYRIRAIDGPTITVERMVKGSGDSVEVDPRWPGFTARTLLDAAITGLNDGEGWLGPFLCCPANEKTRRMELNFVYPQGLVDIGSKDGAIHWHEVQISVQYRRLGDTGWNTVVFKHGNDTVNEIGYTETVEFPAEDCYEVRIKRDTPVWGGTTRDSVQWQAMRSQLASRPNRYSDITTLALTVRTGNRLAAQSDRRINAVVTRLYDGEVSRSLSGAVLHVLRSLGLRDSQIDIDALRAAERDYWTPRGETFDWTTGSDSASALEVLQKIATAGMGYFLLSDGKASVGREGIKPWVGIVTPQETTEPLQSAFKAPSEDDIDGVDVTYTSATTWAEETVQCRIPDNPTPRKIESMKLDGVVDRDRVWRIGMRKLLGYRYQRLTHTTATEMDALCYEFGDRLVLADDIPGSQTQSLLVTGMMHDSAAVTLTVNEPIDKTITNPKAILRFQDGSASGLLTPTLTGDFTLTVPFDTALHPDDWQLNDATIEPLRLLLCSAERVGYGAVVQEITPGNDGTCQLTAVQYDERQYQYDDATYPGNLS